MTATSDPNQAKHWQQLPVRQRCRIVARAAARIADAAEELTELCQSEQRTDPVETIAAELLPLCSALQMIGRRGPRLLKTRYYGVNGRPAWLWGIRSRVHRDPFGDVLILGTWNYPLLLVGTQAAQALAAGNRVLIKPARGSEAVTAAMVDAFYQSGVPRSQLIQLDSSTEAAVDAIQSGVDLVVLTGAADTGRKVLSQIAETLTPSIMELSGCDAVVIMPGADLPRTADAIVFGLNVNSGATCIGPRRLIAQPAEADRLIDLLRDRLKDVPPMIVHPAARSAAADLISDALHGGSHCVTDEIEIDRLRENGSMRPLVLDQVEPDDAIAEADLFAPVTSVLRVDSIDQAVPIINQCRYRLGASVFGPRQLASQLADQLSVGSVCVNDLLAPTADPRLPFGGRGESGFGVTRGEDGLVAMTVPRVICERRNRFAVHLMPRTSSFRPMLLASLRVLHSDSWSARMRAFKDLCVSVTGKNESGKNEKCGDSVKVDHVASNQPDADAQDQSQHARTPGGERDRSADQPITSTNTPR